MNIQVFLYFCLLITAVFSKTDRILGGEITSILEFPHQVAFILLEPEKVVCSGSIISNWHILTAAHCVYKKEEYFPVLRIITGVTNWKRRSGTGYTIDKKYVHPLYTGEMSEKSLCAHDIAVVKLEIAIIYNQYQKKIKLPSVDVIPGRNVIVTGWGVTTYPSEHTSELLHKATVKSMKLDECKKFFNFPVSKAQFCTIRSTGTGTCIGDSGGPVTYNGELIGIISYNVPCAKGAPDVHTNVFSYLPFIKPILQEKNLA